ncbi:Membrane protein involved in ER to Golgi transport [Trachipleistophora hominis]|uniref:Protein transport protein SFT2 n=1 Tax=Trachipleistophora hominis TaxID=72359 RepID=L7JT76_TRAHO|nr:Membrane protein involved in ER to Golgi transport [Trachipleistophora hominis]
MMSNSIRDIFQYSKEYDMSNGIPLKHNKYNRYFRDSTKYDLDYFGLTFSQRLGCFFIFFVAAFLSFVYSLFNILGAIVSPAKFALPYAFSNFLFFTMIGFLVGFRKYFKSTFSQNRWKYTTTFLVCTFLTIYSAMKIKSYFFNFTMAIMQIGSFVVFAITYLPKGTERLGDVLRFALSKN